VKSVDFWQNQLPEKGGFCHEENEVHGGADSVCTEASRNGHSSAGGHPLDGHLGADLLQLEEEVLRAWSVGAPQVKAA